jgi:methylmalonyl-CoA mutase cobalamin-binding subunit
MARQRGAGQIRVRKGGVIKQGDAQKVRQKADHDRRAVKKEKRRNALKTGPE